MFAGAESGGANTNNLGTDATTNTGSSGGGETRDDVTATRGGSGIVIIAYPS